MIDLTEDQVSRIERYVRRCVESGRTIRLPICLALPFIIMIAKEMASDWAALDAMTNEGAPAV